MYKNVTTETNHFISSYVVYILENLTEINFKINDIGLGWSYHFRPGQVFYLWTQGEPHLQSQMGSDYAHLQTRQGPTQPTFEINRQRCAHY